MEINEEYRKLYELFMDSESDYVHQHKQVPQRIIWK